MVTIGGVAEIPRRAIEVPDGCGLPRGATGLAAEFEGSGTRCGIRRRLRVPGSTVEGDLSGWCAGRGQRQCGDKPDRC
ncbi:MAG: hypothetical protein OXE75_03120 [bacterium]|nr:hypothetical protein [bacterium]